MKAEYLPKLRRAFPELCEPEIELMCASDLQVRKMTGLTGYEHRRRAMELLFPNRVWQDWRETRMRSVQECLETRTQELMWMGSASSGKTADMVDAVLALYWTNPRFTTIYVTSPFVGATQTGIWAKIIEQFYEAKTLYPSLPGMVLKDSIMLDERQHPRSFIQPVTVDESGKMKGKKSISPDQGLIAVFLDEFPDFTPNAAGKFVEVLENLTSNQNLLVVGSGNFTSIGDSFARLTLPDENEIPGGWYGFNADAHFRWRTARGGLCLRFDGLQSPNVKAGADIYPYLTRIKFIGEKAAAPGGLSSPQSMREVRSAPVTSLDDFTVTNAERIRAGKAKEPFEWTGGEIKRGAFCDFGLGGDPCVVQKFKLGWMKTPEGQKQVLQLWDAPFVIPIQTGQEVTVQQQAAMGLRRHCEAHGIAPEQVGYDAAMRPGLAQQVGLHYSVRANAIDSDGPATSRRLSAVDMHESRSGLPSTPVLWKEAVDRLISEFWFATASLIDSGQLRGLELSPKAIEQFCTRRWEMRSKKKRIQRKDEYRDLLRAMGRASESPNEADAVVGCVEMARRMGLELDGIVASGGSLAMILGLIREREAMANYRALGERTGLPFGQLHAMSRQTAGKLHRR